MMATTPVSEIVISINRKALDDAAHSLVAIDRGCSLTKAVFVPKDGVGNTSTHYALHCVVFRNNDFEGCLHFLKEKAHLPIPGSIRVTGAGCDKYRTIIENVLGVEIVFVNEFLTMTRGVYFLMNNAEDRNAIFYPEAPLVSSRTIQMTETMGAHLTKMRLEMKRNNGPDPDALFPCIFILVGSGTAILFINQDGTTHMAGGTLIGGKSLLGLGNALVGTSDYDRIMELAAQGKVGNVDTTAGEFIKEDPKSPYGNWPEEYPLFSFGKLADSKKSIDEYDLADRASATVRLVAQSLMSLGSSVARREGVSRIVFGGNGISGEPMQNALKALAEMHGKDIIELKFLRTGATGALGAMISSTEELAQLLQG